MKIHFYLKFHTKYGQTLFITGNCKALGNFEKDAAVPMQYLNDDYWSFTLDLDAVQSPSVQYYYQLKTADGEVTEWGNDRVLDLKKLAVDELTVMDTWNHAGEYDNVFYTQPFTEVLLPRSEEGMTKQSKAISHIFKVKVPLLTARQVLCLIGSNDALGNWGKTTPVLMHKEGNWWTAAVSLTKESFPIAYKYGVYDTETEQIVRYEGGNNRMLYDGVGKKKITLLHDGFAQLPNDTWKGAGLAIPVFSLRSDNSFGVGEFTDIRPLADWAKKVQLKLIQLLPVNDTTANHSWTDSYPYAAISAFALHPMYVNIATIAGSKSHAVVKALVKKQKALNAMDVVDYEEVMALKWDALKKLYAEQKKSFHTDPAFIEFFNANIHWLVPYAAFSYLRDLNGTPDFNQWKKYNVYNEDEIAKLSAPSKKQYDDIAVFYFVQYHLHIQLKAATAYAHEQGIIIKGDIPIGIYRNSCDAWMEPDLYNMDMQAGAPPDDFAVKGQNWGFPTYNWKRMAEDGFGWWKRRFEQMSHYFDAFRIDHILGFFRIWSIPMHAVEGILGYFVPAIPVHVSEFGQKGIWFDYKRLCKPYLTEQVFRDFLGAEASWLYGFMEEKEGGNYELKEAFNTQQKVAVHFAAQEDNEMNRRMKQALYDCISNVILLEEEGGNGQDFHFRISMSTTLSFRYLDQDIKWRLEELYVNYFYRRQDEFWKKLAMDKLPAIKRSTNMLVCGEDLGMVPGCVPEVMKQLGMLSLEIQRMPKDPTRTFFHPADAPYLSVVTPSTHDMSTIRGWWEEDRSKTQDFFNHQLGHFGAAPFYCEPWIVKEILLQHFHSPAMWSIFQIQELLGMRTELRRQNPDDERINVPANPKHYWRYRMHIPIEQLMKEDAFNEEIKEMVNASGRA